MSENINLYASNQRISSDDDYLILSKKNSQKLMHFDRPNYALDCRINVNKTLWSVLSTSANLIHLGPLFEFNLQEIIYDTNLRNLTTLVDHNQQS